MNTSVLKLNILKNKRCQKSILLNLQNKIKVKGILFVLLCVCLVSATLYFYLIIKTTVNIAVYKNLEQKIVEMNSGVGDLEFKYMSLKKEVGLEKARELGFVEIKKINYLEKAVAGKRVTLLGNN